MLESLRNEFNNWLFKVEAAKVCDFSNISVQVIPNCCASISKGTLTCCCSKEWYLYSICVPSVTSVDFLAFFEFATEVLWSCTIYAFEC